MKQQQLRRQKLWLWRSPPPSLSLCLCLCLWLWLPLACSSSPLSSQRDALLALKASLVDPLHHLSDWLPDLPFCSWSAVSCLNDSSVSSLSLSSLRLSGSLSPSIASLPSLLHLSLSHNHLSGPIPPDIAALVNLQSLDLSHNSFHGPLPGRSLANLQQLVHLKLGFNRLQGPLPPELGSLPNLRSLELLHNSFNGSIPQSLASAVNLRFLQLENNTLSGEIPPGIGLLPHLKYLAVEHNWLTGSIPPDFVNVRRISSIYAGWNRLNGTIPHELGNLRRLVHLQLQENALQGEIPPSLGALEDLQELLLYGNKLSGQLPPQLGQLKNLTDLNLSDNNLNGSIPAEIGNMSSLQTLDLQRNNLSGSISPDLGKLSSLKSLNLSYNNLSGQVPMTGVLSKFSAASFLGNSHLCGGPLIRCSPPPPATSTRPPRQQTSPPAPRGSSHRISRQVKIIVSAVAGAIGLCLVIIVLIFVVPRRRKRETVQIQNRFSPDLSDNLRKSKLQMYIKNFRYTYEEIVSRAGYYDTAHVIGKGRFATVFRAILPGGNQLAVKVFRNPISQFTFEREIETLESVKFRNLLPIRGYYSNPAEKVILYDLMSRGTLYDILHRNTESVILPDWSKRHLIALGIAQALAFLHRGSTLRLLHKDLKSTNVLLDDDLIPLVADYGLVGIMSVKSSFVETPGYTPPELSSSRKYTEKTDVYAFGVVFLELLTGKKPVSYIGDRELTLVSWVIRLHKDGRGKEALDPLVVETCAFQDYLDRALKLAILCLCEQPAQRPTMSEVASIIEGLGGSASPLRSPGPSVDKPLLL